MVKEKIIEFSKKQVIEKSIKEVDSNNIKYERIYADLSKYFGENDTIEFDDSAESFLSIKESSNMFDTFKALKLKVVREGKEIDIKRESFHCVIIINKCIMSFFAYGE